MSSPPGWRSRRVLVAFALLAIILTTTTAAYWLYGGAERGMPPWFSRNGGQQSDQHRQMQPQSEVNASPLRTLPSTILIFDRVYESCEHEVTESEPAGEQRAGLTAAELEQLLPGWRVLEFSREAVRLEQQLPDECPADAAVYTLSIHDGRVVIFSGRGLAGPIFAETEIQAADLLPGDLALLENGVTVEGEERAWQFLEGITDHQGS